jgi:hypothetical protein
MLGAALDFIFDMNRVVLFGVVGGVLAVCLFAFVYLVFIKGGDETPGGTMDLSGQIDFSALADSGAGGGAGPGGAAGPAAGPVMLEESVVAERVAATVEAMGPRETPVPTPTPDIAATLQAELNANRSESDRILKLDPLSSGEPRNPYLTQRELERLAGMGPALWSHTKAWLHVREVLSLGVGDWSSRFLGYHVFQAESYVSDFAEARGRRGRGSDDVGKVVAAYALSLEEGMQSVRSSVASLRRAAAILERSESGAMVDLPFEEREQIARLAREAEEQLVDFDNAMSQYGCSVCGELFRLREGG